MQEEVELVQAVKDDGAGTELLLSGQGDERLVIVVHMYTQSNIT